MAVRCRRSPGHADHRRRSGVVPLDARRARGRSWVRCRWTTGAALRPCCSAGQPGDGWRGSDRLCVRQFRHPSSVGASTIGSTARWRGVGDIVAGTSRRFDLDVAGRVTGVRAEAGLRDMPMTCPASCPGDRSFGSAGSHWRRGRMTAPKSPGSGPCPTGMTGRAAWSPGPASACPSGRRPGSSSTTPTTAWSRRARRGSAGATPTTPSVGGSASNGSASTARSSSRRCSAGTATGCRAGPHRLPERRPDRHHLGLPAGQLDADQPDRRWKRCRRAVLRDRQRPGRCADRAGHARRAAGSVDQCRGDRLGCSPAQGRQRVDQVRSSASTARSGSPASTPTTRPACTTTATATTTQSPVGTPQLTLSVWRRPTIRTDMCSIRPAGLIRSGSPRAGVRCRRQERFRGRRRDGQPCNPCLQRISLMATRSGAVTCGPEAR